MKKYAIFITLILLPCQAFSGALPTGDEIAANINARDEGVTVARDITMELMDKHGKTRVRKTRSFRKYFDGEKRSALFYLSPKNVKGTAFLTYDYTDGGHDDDQWLYLPAMRKVRRISASNRGDYFLGTDLTYEEIKLETKVSTDDYTRKTLGESDADGEHCILIQAVPASKQIEEELGYSQVQQCVDDRIWMVRWMKSWDTQGNLLKTAHFSDIRQVQGIWTVHKVEVDNHKTGHKTVFSYNNVIYNKGVDDNLFTQNNLRRGL